MLEASQVQAGNQPNPPHCSDSTVIFSASTASSQIELIINSAPQVNGGSPQSTCNNGKFSSNRLPGVYENLDVPVGYCTSIYSIGVSPPNNIFAVLVRLGMPQVVGHLDLKLAEPLKLALNSNSWFAIRRQIALVLLFGMEYLRAPSPQCGKHNVRPSESVEPNTSLSVEKPFIASTEGSIFKLVLQVVWYSKQNMKKGAIRKSYKLYVKDLALT